MEETIKKASLHIVR